MPKRPTVFMTGPLVRKTERIRNDVDTFKPLPVRAEVYPKHYVRFIGKMGREKQSIDRVFRPGDLVYFDTVNSSFYGRILEITAKNVLVRGNGIDRRLPFYDFIVRNWDVDDQKIISRFGTPVFDEGSEIGKSVKGSDLRGMERNQEIASQRKALLRDVEYLRSIDIGTDDGIAAFREWQKTEIKKRVWQKERPLRQSSSARADADPPA